MVGVRAPECSPAAMHSRGIERQHWEAKNPPSAASLALPGPLAPLPRVPAPGSKPAGTSSWPCLEASPQPTFPGPTLNGSSSSMVFNHAPSVLEAPREQLDVKNNNNAMSLPMTCPSFVSRPDHHVQCVTIIVLPISSRASPRQQKRKFNIGHRSFLPPMPNLWFFSTFSERLPVVQHVP
jgi:hypothetical protein